MPSVKIANTFKTESNGSRACIQAYSMGVFSNFFSWIEFIFFNKNTPYTLLDNEPVRYIEGVPPYTRMAGADYRRRWLLAGVPERLPIADDSFLVFRLDYTNMQWAWESMLARYFRTIIEKRLARCRNNLEKLVVAYEELTPYAYILEALNVEYKKARNIPKTLKIPSHILEEAKELLRVLPKEEKVVGNSITLEFPYQIYFQGTENIVIPIIRMLKSVVVKGKYVILEDDNA